MIEASLPEGTHLIALAAGAFLLLTARNKPNPNVVVAPAA